MAFRAVILLLFLISNLTWAAAPKDEVPVAVPSNWPGAAVNPAQGYKQLAIDHKPGIAFIHPTNYKNTDADLKHEHTHFKNFMNNVLRDKDLLQKIKDQFVCFCGPQGDKNFRGDVACQGFALAILAPDGKRITLWEDSPSLPEFEAALDGLKAKLDKIKEEAAAARLREEAQAKKEREEEERKRKDQEIAQKFPGLDPPKRNEKKTGERKTDAKKTEAVDE